MKSFAQYLNENIRVSTRQEVEDVLSMFKKEGEILNPQFQDLTSQVRRIFGKESEAAKKTVFQELIARGDMDVTEVYYDWPSDSFVSLNKFERGINKLASKTSPDVQKIVAAARPLIQYWKPIANDLKDLKGKVVKVTAKREQKKAEAEVVLKQKFSDSSSLIKVLEAHLNEYKQAAHNRAKEFIDTKIQALHKADNDLTKLAPQPTSMMSHAAYQTAQAKRYFYLSIVDAPVSTRRGEPEIVKVNQEKVKHYIDQAVSEAEASYRAFMQKMIEKIGKTVIDAHMTGSIWVGATLTVKTIDGETQVWETKMILNFSKYQKMFNQFPSRRKK